MSIGKPAEHAPKLILGPRCLAHATDVMQTGRERVFTAAKGLRETAKLEMLFKDENVTPASSQGCCGCKSPYSRTEDDTIVFTYVHTQYHYIGRCCVLEII